MSTEKTSPRDAAAQIDLLGLVAYGSLAAFERTAAASAAASEVADKLVLARIAAQRFTHLGGLEQELVARGSSLDAAMAPFVAPVDSFNAHSEPRTWGEALVKLCVIGGLVQDFATEVGANLDPELQDVLVGSIDDGDLRDEPGRMLAQVLAEDPERQGRLALFGRRMLGEALSQTQRVASRQGALTGLLTGVGEEGDDLAEISVLMSRLAAAHADRMESLGLA